MDPPTLGKGSIPVVGRKSPDSLYPAQIVTFAADQDACDPRNDAGVITLDAPRPRPSPCSSSRRTSGPMDPPTLGKGGIPIVGRKSPGSFHPEQVVRFADDQGACDRRDAAGVITLNARRPRPRPSLRSSSRRTSGPMDPPTPPDIPTCGDTMGRGVRRDDQRRPSDPT